MYPVLNLYELNQNNPPHNITINYFCNNVLTWLYLCNLISFISSSDSKRKNQQQAYSALESILMEFEVHILINIFIFI